MFAADTDVSSWAALVGSIANVGFAAVVGWYLLTRALPKMQEDFRQEMKEERAGNATIDRERRIEHRESLQLVIAHCEREAERRERDLHAEMMEINKVIMDNREVMEEVRDCLRLVGLRLQEQESVHRRVPNTGE